MFIYSFTTGIEGGHPGSEGWDACPRPPDGRPMRDKAEGNRTSLKGDEFKE
jgi:hypothetical protein